MTKYREILRLKSLGFSERNIAHSCGVSRNTVAKVVKRAAEMNLSWPLDHDMTDSALEEMLFPKVKSATNRRMPDYDYIRRELLRNGVNKKLLWVKYCEECRMNSEEPLMYSQFCYYIQKDEEKRRATMHIPRKPGEQIEVDWAGDPAQLIDPDTGEITDALVASFSHDSLQSLGLFTYGTSMMPWPHTVPEWAGQPPIIRQRQLIYCC